MSKINRQWLLARRPDGQVSDADLRFVSGPVPYCGDGEALVRNFMLSLDPTNRIWMSEIDQYMDPVAIGDVMRGGTLGVVEESRNLDLHIGDVVFGFGGWQDYWVTRDAKAIPRGSLPSSAYMSVLGVTGATAYFGVTDIARPRAGETMVVSAAAGAVGSIAGQIGKIQGCRVVGIAGGPEKCARVVNHYGFDACIDYKSENLSEALRRHCPDGIDIDFENVGGRILDDILGQINIGARIVLCGLISQYDADGRAPGPVAFPQILMKRARCEGLIITDYLNRFGEFHAAVGGWLAEQRIEYDVHVEFGLENAITALRGLFSGMNTGKMLLQISEPPW